MNKAYSERPMRELATGKKIDLVFEAQECLREMFKAVMKLEWADRHNIQNDKAFYYGSFREHRTLFIHQVESDDFPIPWKISLYNDLLNCCLTILKHNHRDIYPFKKHILKLLHHYIGKVVKRMHELNKQLEPETDLLKNAMRLSYNYYCERVTDEYSKPSPDRRLIDRWLIQIVEIKRVLEEN